MGEVVEILDTSQMILYDSGEEEVGMVRPHIVFWKEYGEEKNEVVDFVTVESPFYPELETYYDRQKEIWFDE